MGSSEQSKQAVWAFLSETERLARYYQARTQNYNAYNAFLTWFLVFTGLIGTVLLSFNVDRGWQLAVSLALAGAAVLNASTRFGEKAASLKIIGERSRALNTRAHRLWRQVSSLTAVDIEDTLQQLEERLHAEVNTWAIGSGVPVSYEAKASADAQAKVALEARYAATSAVTAKTPEATGGSG